MQITEGAKVQHKSSKKIGTVLIAREDGSVCVKWENGKIRYVDAKGLKVL